MDILVIILWQFFIAQVWMAECVFHHQTICKVSLINQIEVNDKTIIHGRQTNYCTLITLAVDRSSFVCSVISTFAFDYFFQKKAQSMLQLTQCIRGFKGDYALHKSTFYWLTFSLTHSQF